MCSLYFAPFSDEVDICWISSAWRVPWCVHLINCYWRSTLWLACTNCCILMWCVHFAESCAPTYYIKHELLSKNIHRMPVMIFHFSALADITCMLVVWWIISITWKENYDSNPNVFNTLECLIENMSKFVSWSRQKKLIS
jgi:hypothetical protein